ncbi:MAG: hypothetical protein J5597_05970 [Spirochaetaceae bacterium]|nr:hypothetical protein [Spirochaetaceae bacterium]MBR4824346.1 hypothetical protein [Spirochaetaceae bacterium]
MTSNFSKRAIKDISKLEKSIQDAIFNYFESLEKYSMAEIYEHGAKDLKGNLKGLIRFKDKSFQDYRVVGAKRDETVVLMLCCEQRSKVYKNKEDMAKTERKQK